MAKPKVFISSTCYDLGNVRSELRPFIESLGYEAVMSDNSDVLYDPRRHTHDSCIKELPSSDMLLLIIGSRHGGEAVPSAKALVDFEALNGDWTDSTLAKFKDKLSITQIETIKAVETGIPIYAFVQNDVHRDHEFYEKNKDNPVLIEQMKFPAIQKRESAVYIFEFINFLRRRSVNNSIFQFATIEDIRSQLKSQWAHLFQRLLNESLTSERTSQEFRAFSNQIEDLKAVILTSIGSSHLKETAKGVLRFRMLVEFLLGLKLTRAEILGEASFEELLAIAGVGLITHRMNERLVRQETYLIKDDNSFFRLRGSDRTLARIESDWEEFKVLEQPAREAVFSALNETLEGRPMMLVRHIDENVDEYLKKFSPNPDSGEEDA